MGKVYYDMGLLATAEVVECSATELVGQYVGQTGPKTQKLLEKALGKVLFIDEAYRLAEGAFATEAMDELVDCLTKPRFAQKLVTILAGYDADINRLMTINPGLTSRFPEAVIFHNLTPEQCLQLFRDLLKKKKKVNITVLNPPSDALYRQLIAYFDTLTKLPAWGNARDVQTLTKNVFSAIISTVKAPISGLVATEEGLLKALQSMVSERSHRSEATSWSRFPPSSEPLPTASMDPPLIQTQTSTQIATQNDTAPPETPPPPHGKELEVESQCHAGHAHADVRDAGVSDAIWKQLQQDKQAATAREVEAARLHAEMGRLQEAAAQEAKRVEAELAALEAAAIADAEAKRAHEAMRIKRELERRAVEAEWAELERQRKAAEERWKKEQVAQQKLRQMGICPAGFQWIKQAHGYRCSAGGHFVSDEALGMA
jgi:hypothetical protein